MPWIERSPVEERKEFVRRVRGRSYGMSELCDRYGGVVTKCEFSIAVKSDADRERLRQLAADIQSEDIARARHAILGPAA